MSYEISSEIEQGGLMEILRRNIFFYYVCGYFGIYKYLCVHVVTFIFHNSLLDLVLIK